MYMQIIVNDDWESVDIQVLHVQRRDIVFYVYEYMHI